MTLRLPSTYITLRHQSLLHECEWISLLMRVITAQRSEASGSNWIHSRLPPLLLSLETSERKRDRRRKWIENICIALLPGSSLRAREENGATRRTRLNTVTSDVPYSTAMPRGPELPRALQRAVSSVSLSVIRHSSPAAGPCHVAARTQPAARSPARCPPSPA